MNKEAVLNNIQLAQQGDETAKELIVKNNLGLVWSIVIVLRIIIMIKKIFFK